MFCSWYTGIYSVKYSINAATSCIIVNDACYVTDIVPTSDNIKSIGSNCVQLLGTSKLRLPLNLDDGRAFVISNCDDVYVPSSPYNILPP